MMKWNVSIDSSHCYYLFHHLLANTLVRKRTALSIVFLSLIILALSTTTTLVALKQFGFHHLKKRTFRSPITAATTSSSNRSKRIITAAAGKLEAPAAERNKKPIWDVISSRVLPQLLVSNNRNNDGSNSKNEEEGKQQLVFQIVEVAAGCGVHTSYFASQLVNNNNEHKFVWYPTDPDVQCRDSIQCYIDDDNLASYVKSPQLLTLNQGGAQEEDVAAWCKPNCFDLVMCINMIHISSWDSTLGLMKLSGEILRRGGILYLYGPYKVCGTAVPSNLQFDRNLRSSDSSWGVRSLEDVITVAEENGLELVETVEMPAKNLSVLFCRK